jgi:multidrug efflux pump subunit AcrA (membrane-fusion protein)
MPDGGGSTALPDVTGVGGDPKPSGTGRFSVVRVGLVVVVVAAVALSWGLTRSSSPSYRTAVVGTGTAEATLDSVGTITPVNQAALNFNVAGTVDAVDVSVGQTVTAGQTLASLDVAPLNATVTSDRAALATAHNNLASAQASEATTVSTSTASATTATTSASTGGAPSGAGGQQIEKLQAALVAAQTQEDTDATQAAATLATATTLCEPSGSTATGVPATSSSPSASGTDTAGATAAANGPPGTGSLPTTTAPTTGSAPTTCGEALAQATSAQSTVAADIKSVNQAESALNAALQSASGSSGSGAAGGSGGSTPTTTVPVTSSRASTSGTTGSGSAGLGSGGSSKKATPQQLALDQATIDTAQATLSDAQQALSGATLSTTIAGTVASVSIAPGQSVTAGSSSSTPQIVVIGSGSAYQLSTDVAVTDISQVHVGQQATVTPDTTNTALVGQVASISVLATSGSSTTTYPVTVALTSSDLGQISGSEADVSVVVARSTDVTTVPTSAVRTVGTTHLVSVVEGGTVKPVRVTVGTVGDLLTQVKSGLTPGQVVSLADLSEPLPSTSTTTTRTGFGGAGLGGVGGAGGFGGAAGFGGGGGRLGG